MIFWWMGYAAGVGVLLAGGAWAGERLCESMGWPRRFPWVAALTLAIVIPLSARPPAPVLEISAAAPSPVTSVVQGADPAVPAISGTGWERAAIFAWGAASLATLLVFGAILGLMNRSRRRWPRRSVDGEDVYVSAGFGPALIGVTRPSVVIPDWLLCAGDRAGRVAILHEREHARARDHLTLLYGAIIAALFPWSPAVWWMVRNLRGAVEIDCDRRVIASGIPADDYGKLLLAIGVGRHRRWLFTPALVESRHSLERRLKTMAAKKIKWSPLRAVTMAGLTVAALVIACDTNAPTALDDALLDVLAEPGAVADGNESGEPELFTRSQLNDGARPLIFIDGLEVSSPDLSLRAGKYTVTTAGEDPYSPLNSLNPDDIERIEVIKGSAAADLHGERANAGVIQIFTKEASGNDAPPLPPPGDAENDRPDIQISGRSGTASLRVARELTGALRSVEGTLARSSEGINLTIEPARARSSDNDSRPIDLANAMELANGLMVLIRQIESLGTPAPSR